MIARVPDLGTWATVRCGCMRRSVVELIGMLGKTALGKCPIFARAFPVILVRAPGSQGRVFAQSSASDAVNRPLAIRLKCEAV